MSTNAIIICVIGVALALFVVVFWIITQYSNRHYASYIKNGVNSIRSVIVDLNKQEVRFFNRTYLRYVRTIALEKYYWQFSKNDAKKLNEWFNELVKRNNKVDESCEVEVRLHRARRYYRSLLQVVNIDYDNLSEILNKQHIGLKNITKKLEEIELVKFLFILNKCQKKENILYLLS